MCIYRYIMKESIPFCCECFDKSHPKVCEGCKLSILVDQPNTEHEVCWMTLLTNFILLLYLQVNIELLS